MPFLPQVGVEEFVHVTVNLSSSATGIVVSSGVSSGGGTIPTTPDDLPPSLYVAAIFGLVSETASQTPSSLYAATIFGLVAESTPSLPPSLYAATIFGLAP